MRSSVDSVDKGEELILREILFASRMLLINRGEKETVLNCATSWRTSSSR